MAVPDPVDVRVLAVLAESGKIAVADIAGRLGMDPREVAARLLALSASGLPLMVGVECDPNGIRAAIANAGGWGNYPPNPNMGPPSGPYAMPPNPGMPPPIPGPNPGQSGPYPPPPRPNYGVSGGPSGSYPPPGSFPPPGFPPQQQPAPVPARAGNTWGPPGSATWARGDQPPRQAAPPPPPAPERHEGTIGETLRTEGLEGERIAINLIEVVDPADFLFTAAGYRLRDGERAVVVHTEMTNLGTAPYQTLPDLYLVLVAADGSTVSKAPVSLSSRPPHRIGVAPGDTAGGHTVYVLPDEARITAVRWSARPDEDKNSLTWTVE
ncbi:MAG TPA: AsnC family protein [Pseudonocardiaceae bacterium]|nr:AsnC family protein [Pseudonocardiaceae bacterium]